MMGYLEIVRRLERPSFEQVIDFVGYVCSAHSWYKHIPLRPPGAAFFFYLDPNAGCDLILHQAGREEYRERTEQGFHYNAIPTSEYRTRFGHLEHFVKAGTRIMLGDPEGVLSTRNPGPAVLSKEGWVEVPEELLRAGRVEVTGIIHPHCAEYGFGIWVYWLGSARSADLAWLNETFEHAAVERILNICQAPDPHRKLGKEIDRLVEPERNRQKRLMVEAVNCVLEVIYQPSI